MQNRIDYQKMNNESFRLWLVYLKTHPIIKTIKDLKKNKDGIKIRGICCKCKKEIIGVGAGD